MDEETWLPVPIERFAELYQVSNLGRVRSLHKRWREPKILAQTTDEHGYQEVCLCRDSKPYTAGVHRLVAGAFLADKRNALHREVAHVDGSRTNNAANNLRWVSHTENMAHMVPHGTVPRGERHTSARLTEAAVVEIRSLPRGAVGNVALAEKFDVSRMTVASIRSGKGWPHVRHGYRG